MCSGFRVSSKFDPGVQGDGVGLAVNNIPHVHLDCCGDQRRGFGRDSPESTRTPRPGAIARASASWQLAQSELLWRWLCRAGRLQPETGGFDRDLDHDSRAGHKI
jgi:hypothetical protein